MIIEIFLTIIKMSYKSMIPYFIAGCGVVAGHQFYERYFCERYFNNLNDLNDYKISDSPCKICGISEVSMKYKGVCDGCDPFEEDFLKLPHNID